MSLKKMLENISYIILKMTAIRELINKHLLIILGGIIFSLYFWNRFLRFRTSKVLPLDLTVIRFLTILMLCIIFGYILILTIYPRKSNDILEKITEFIFIPIGEFDKYLKSFLIIREYYVKSLNYILPWLEYLMIRTNILYTLLWIIPRLTLLIALWVDVFIFYQLHLKYYVILIGVFLFFNRYLKYSLKIEKYNLISINKDYIYNIETPYVPGIHPAELEPDYNPDDPDEQDIIEYMYLPFETFIKYQTESIVYQNVTREFGSIFTSNKLFNKLWIEYIGTENPSPNFNQEIPIGYKNLFGDKIPDNYNQAAKLIREKCKEFAYTSLEQTLKISLLLEYYNKNINQHKQIKYIKILVYLNYCLCWLFVLIVSLPNLHILELLWEMNKTWLLLEDPFSCLKICYQH